MNKHCKQKIREIQNRNSHIAAKFWLLMYKLDIIHVPKLPSWQMPHDEEHRQRLVRAMVDSDCRVIGKHLMEKYGSERIDRIKRWRMVVS